MATKRGVVKKTSLSEFTNIRKTGIIAIKLDKSDTLSWVKLTTGEDDIVLITEEAKIISFTEEQVRPTGRSSMGVRGIKLLSDDRVISADVTASNAQIIVIAENGLGKKTDLSEVRNQNRGGQGVRIATLSAKTGRLVYAGVIPTDTKDNIIITSEKGQVVKIPIKTVPKRTRNAQGVILMRFSSRKDDKVASATCISSDEADE